MGCGSSKPGAQGLPSTTIPSASSQDPTEENQSISNQQVRKTYSTVNPKSRPRDDCTDYGLPSYARVAPERSAELILWVFQRGLTLQMHGIINAFYNCKHRRYKICIDDNPALEKSSRMAIQMFTMLLFLIGKGTECDMEFLWMSRSNLESQEIEEKDRGKAKALNLLMETDNWNTACNMIRTESDLQELGLKAWLERQTDQSADLQRHCTADGANSNPKEERASEKHARLLAEARNLSIQYSAGWELKNIVDTEELENLDKEAVKEAKKQSRVRNKVSFTLQKEIRAYKREMDREGAGTPTTVVLLVGSPIVEAEKNSIIKCQKDTGFTSKSSRNTVTGDMFCIQTLAFIDYMPQDSVTRFQQIDKAFHGNMDINDLTEVSESKLLEYGPTEKLFLKVLNSHLQSVDKSHLSTKDMYGKDKLCVDGGSIVYPTIKDVKRLFGADNEDSEDGSGPKAD